MLAEALRSIFSQTFQSFEIIVVNDGGLDVNSVLRLNKRRNVIYVNHDRNKGLGAARNTALRVASGKYVAYLDDDDIFYTDHLETLVTFLETTKSKVAYTNAYRRIQKNVDGNYVTLMRDLPYTYDFDYDRILIGNSVPVICFMHERSCVDAVGFFDETLPSLEDWEFWIRVSRYYKIHHVDRVTCEFRWREDQSTMTSARRQEFLGITKAIYSKHHDLTASKPLVSLAQQLNLQYLRLYSRGSGIHGVRARNMLRRLFFLKRIRVAPDRAWWAC